ncbi:MAG: hypothetical protein CVV27_15175 [Candidatus Melainabacteria bacterium HGW-Melainabacteria-1]|nr:MAG: hypothetical protein CVV27_15175 [Candidatus Melainabacteria bacterium HGW-Melainabacteria-1]
MKATLLRQEIIPFSLTLMGLFLLTIYLDLMLHLFSWAWLGRYLGIPGVLLILLSFGYSLRKRGLIRFSTPKRLLELHEIMTLVGALLICIHAGLHFNAWLPWLALAALLTNIVSGLIGRILLKRSQQRLKAMKAEMKTAGKPAAVIEAAFQEASVATDLMKKWRSLHFPITFVFVALSALHVLSVILLGGAP